MRLTIASSRPVPPACDKFNVLDKDEDELPILLAKKSEQALLF
tara:strand:+ start:761 stop:889 length:129 start_codon:yes stop_codon:yes gene_type:complete